MIFVKVISLKSTLEKQDKSNKQARQRQKNHHQTNKQKKETKKKRKKDISIFPPKDQLIVYIMAELFKTREKYLNSKSHPIYVSDAKGGSVESLFA